MKRKSFINESICFAAWLLLVFVLTFSIPEGLFVKGGVFWKFLFYVGGGIPSIRNLMEISQFPTIAAPIYALQLVLVPLCAFRMVTVYELSVVGMRNVRIRAMMAVPFFFAMVVGLVIVFPGDPDGHVFSSRIAKAIVESKLGFAWWSTVFSMALSGALAVLWFWVSSIPKVFFKPN